MTIDWFTFLAQIVNFLILVALLRRLLYAPISRAMKQREETIASRLELADERRQQAEQMVEAHRQQQQKLDDQIEQLLREAQQRARHERDRLLEEARSEVGRKRDEWMQTFDREREALLDDWRQRTGRAAVEATRQLLLELAGVSLEQRILETFAERLRSMDGEQRDEFRTYLTNGEGGVRVRSAFQVSAEWRDRLHELIRKQFGHEAEISFERSAEMICGLELITGGYSFGWNADMLLRSIGSEFHHRMGEPADD